MKKRIISDMALNIVASAIPVFVLQLIILPSIAGRMDQDGYGLVVTCLSMFNLISTSSGNAVNNIRLINEYRKWKSYNYEILVIAILNVALISVLSWYYYGGFDFSQMLLNVAVGLLWYFKEYFIVAFRIKLNYLHIVKSNIILTAGYLTGFGLFVLLSVWQLVYIIGFIFCLVYIMLNSDLWKEEFIRASDFHEMMVQTTILLLATVLVRIPTYADKMIAYPLLGAKNTSILYIATLFGKIVSMIITPVSGVILSYLAKNKKKDNNVFSLTIVTGGIVGIIGYFVCMLITQPLLGIIYPNYISDVMVYIPVTTGTVILTAMIGIVDPFLINFFNLKWQIVINSGYVVVYLFLSTCLMRQYSLYGFCVGALLTEAGKLLFEIIVFYRCGNKQLSM